MSHSWTQKVCHWIACARCGLIWLKNDTSRRAAKKSCTGVDDPSE